jgi:MarR family transcriptional regulator for hemolysin
MKPTRTPIGLQLARTSKRVSRAFADALSEAGGSVPMWLVLTNLQGQSWPAQHQLARALGIEGPTLTRHLDGLEDQGLVVRTRAPGDRRATLVEITEAGREKHAALLEAVIRFNHRLHAGFAEAEVEQLRGLLERLEQNVGAES